MAKKPTWGEKPTVLLDLVYQDYASNLVNSSYSVPVAPQQ